MSGLRGELERYLVIRRALGFKLARAELLLTQFLGYLDGIDPYPHRDAPRTPTPSFVMSPFGLGSPPWLPD